jgi:hypothetical protein
MYKTFVFWYLSTKNFWILNIRCLFQKCILLLSYWTLFGYSNVASECTFVCYWRISYMRAICKVCGLTLLLWVRTLWKCGDSLFFKVPPLAINALLAMLHPHLENELQTVDHFEISCLGASFSWLEKPRNSMDWDLNWILCLAWKNWLSGTPLEHLPYSPDLTPCDSWAFPTMKKEVQGKKFQSDQQSAAHFWEAGRAL